MRDNDTARPQADRRITAPGPGMHITWHCMGCNTPPNPTGSKGKGAFRRCAVCLSKRKP